MAMKKLGLTRDQLASFLSDHEKVKQFENLFGTTNKLIDITEGAAIEAGGALANANIALDLVHKLAQDSAISSAIADIKAEEALLQIDRLMSEIGGLQMMPVHPPVKRARYGQFYDTTIQTAAAINTAYAITYNTTDLSYGVFLQPGNSQIQVDTEGVYNFQFSIQLDKTSGGTASFWIWPRVNGVNVANSASQVRIQGNDAEIFSAANFFLDLKAGDYVQFMWAVSDTSVQLQYFAAAGVVPAIPSIIVTVSNNIRV